MRKIKHIGIAGEGKMGTSIFLFLLGYNFRLTWLCSDSTGKEKALKQTAKKINILLKSGVLTAEAYRKKNKDTNVTDKPDELRDCDLVIEAIPENLQVKKDFFHQLDKHVRADCIFTTNSSSIVPSRLIPSESRKAYVAGMHFFFPVNLKKTVELIPGPDTSEETILRLMDFLRNIDKSIFLQKESDAFILNRFLLDFQAEVYNICQAGNNSYRQMDELVKERFFPAGVFEFFDHVGIDLMLASIRNYIEDEPDKGFYSPLVACMEELVQNNHLGLKTGKGFFNYDLKGRPDIDNADQQGVIAGKSAEIENKLKETMERNYRKLIASGSVSPKVLDEALKDYLGIDDLRSWFIKKPKDNIYPN